MIHHPRKSNHTRKTNQPHDTSRPHLRVLAFRAQGFSTRIPKRWMGLVALMLLCMPFQGCQKWLPQSSQESRMYQEYQVGLQSFDKKQYAKALGVFLKLQSQYPDHMELMYNLGTVYYQFGKTLADKDPKRKEHLNKAEKYLSQVCQNGSASLRQKSHYNLGLVHTERRQYEQALVHFSSASNIARQTLKQPDLDAEYNRDQIAMLIRQRERQQEKLNRSRVFRYAPKVIRLTASKAYTDPLRQIALQAKFTHQTTNKTYTVWGYPVSQREWEVRFVPTHTGKWNYTIKTIKRPQPDSQAQTESDRLLQDKGLFKVLPSGRVGQLVVATANAIRLAWKKPKEEVQAKAKTPTKPSAKGSQTPASTQAKSPIPEDETIVMWQGLHIPDLFSPKLSSQRFKKHYSMLELTTPSAITVDLAVDSLFSLDAKKALRATPALDTLVKRLETLRSNPTHRWVFVYTLRSEKEWTSAQLHAILGYLVARLAHVDVVWSLQVWDSQQRDLAIGFLRSFDPYQQPISIEYDPKLAKQVDAPSETQKTQLSQSPLPGAKSVHPGKSATDPKTSVPKQAKEPEPTLFQPNPKYKHLLWQTAHNIATGEALQKVLMRPWIGELPLPAQTSAKGLQQQWWKLYIAGINTTLVMDRALNDDELDEVIQWQRKAHEAEEDKLPPHPEEQAKAPTQKAGDSNKASTQATTRPTLGQPLSPSSIKPGKTSPSTPSSGNTSSGTQGGATQKSGGKPSAKASSPQTPVEERISRSYLHFLRIRHFWMKFLASFRFYEYVRPSMVRVAMPDVEAIKAWQQKQEQKQFQLPGVNLSPGPRSLFADPKSKTQLAPPSQRNSRQSFSGAKPNTEPESKQPPVRWKQVPMRGFLASNGPTVLFVPPDTNFKQAPQINWRNTRWDLEFQWYNATTGTFLEKKVFRQVTSLALTAPEKTAHIAKVSVQDHQIHSPYTIVLPPSLLKQATTKPIREIPWQLKDWMLVVTPPKPQSQQQGQHQQQPPLAPQQLTFVRTSQGYAARFLPNRMGIWSFQILHKGKKLAGLWQYPGKIQVIPSALPGPIQRQQQHPMRMVMGGRPYFFFAKAVPNLLSAQWSNQQFEDTIAALPQTHPGTTVLVTYLPSLSWNSATSSATSAPTTQPQKIAPNTMWSATLSAELDRLENRLQKAHQAGYHIALILSPQEWEQIFQTGGTQRLEYLLDRFASAYPLLWVVDKSNAKTMQSFLPMLIRAWYFKAYPKLQQELIKSKGKARPKEMPTSPPPMVGVHIGRPRSEKLLQEATKSFDWLWLHTSSLEKEIQDFKLTQLQRPVVLTWKPLLNPQSPFAAKAKSSGASKPGATSPKGSWDRKAIERWAGFLWKAQMIGFSHAGRALNQPLKAPPVPTKGQTQTTPKPSPVAQVSMVLRGFFQTFDWNLLKPPAQTLELPSYEAFAAETPISVQPSQPSQQGKTADTVQMPQGGHHLVAWINPSVRQFLQIKRSSKIPLNKHRYLWINPMSGEQPVTPQLLPPQPAKGQNDQLQVPFRPAVLYVFRRPPQKGQPQQQRRQQKQQQDQNASQRQQVRNQVRNLQDEPNTPKRQRQQRSLTGKRG